MTLVPVRKPKTCETCLFWFAPTTLKGDVKICQYSDSGSHRDETRADWGCTHHVRKAEGK